MTMFQIFRLVSLQHIWRHKLRTIFVLLLITIGSTSMFVAFDAIYKRDSTFAIANSLAHGKASISIQAGDNTPIDTEMLNAINASNVVNLAAPIVVDFSLFLNNGWLQTLVGIDPSTENQVRSYELVEGEFLTQEGQILITEASSEEYQIGDTLRFIGKGGLRTYEVVGIVAKKGLAAMNGGSMFFLHYSDVQALGNKTTFEFVSVVPSGNTNDAIAQLKSSLPDTVSINDLTVRPDKSLQEIVIDMLGIITNGIPALFGALMITSTLSSSVAQRRKEIAILRSLGSTQGDVQRILVIEATIVGLIGSIGGLLLAIMLNQFALTGSASAEAFSYEAPEVSTPIWLYSLVLISGVVMAIAAMWIPARRTAAIDPTEAMRQPLISAENVSYSKLRIVAGVLLLVFAVVCRIVFDNSPLAPLAVLTGMVPVIAGIVLLFAPFMNLVIQLVSKITPYGLGFSTLLTTENLRQRQQKVLATGLLSVIVVWFVGLVGTFDSGAAYTAKQFLDYEYNWDLVVTGAGVNVRHSIASIPTNAVDDIASREEVDTVIMERASMLSYENMDFNIRAIDLENFFNAGGRMAWEYGDESAAYARLLEHDKPAIVVGGFQSLMLGWRQVGQTITLPTPAGDVEFEVVGSINTVGDFIVMDRALYVSLWGDTEIDRMNINLVEGVDGAAFRDSISQRYGASGIIVADREEIEAIFAQADSALVVTSAILLPFMMLGLANMFFISVLDRRREFGMLRAIGTQQRQIIWSVILESLLIVGCASLLAMPATMLSVEAMLFSRIAGTQIQVESMQLLNTIMLVIIAASIAAYLPARRAAKLDILEALRYE